MYDYKEILYNLYFYYCKYMLICFIHFLNLILLIMSSKVFLISFIKKILNHIYLYLINKELINHL
jgi:hypothetical protein